MKSLSIKIPIKIAVDMDDRGNLNPSFMKSFINTHKYRSFDNSPINGLTLPYTFKIDDSTHKAIKLLAIEHDLPMNEFISRLLFSYYWDVNNG